MVDGSAILAIALIALGLVLTPGPNMIYLASRSISQGRRAGLVSLLGVGAGFLVYLAFATAGLAAVFVTVPAAYTVLKIAGALYLLFLAWQAIRGGNSPFQPKDLAPDSRRKLFGMGVLTCLLNPKIAILYVSLLPQFVDEAHGAVWLQSLVLGLVQIAVAITVNGLVVLTAGGLSRFFSAREGWLRAQRYTMGAVLGFFAVRMLTDRRAAA
ncbi:threonine/homoserine/homoserine lactone efflux protein [Herbihabitans rhizosphaerae]|uniref:Threonine/homoserine/homoserine lactone efflux protein n=1 Tax=Herbihabitans rhizosphaerae TaxID=1872711 RepID=A0A4Q7L996_9PSEU|nr:LysE family translocator [Herbihabitans rhizosphaerae]RZS45002.1 threonine/homoserine/homoserine lactone efflux protein [Herbihabitans rhizosphaerae]